ncbi:MAG: hypothetical protein PUE18_06635 [Firmicutes bacterium]|nr:hypothetical protein [Bacillota bacterium]
MKMFIKKVMPIFIVMSLIMSLPMNVFASSENENVNNISVKIDSGLQSVQAIFYPKSSTVTISEYDIICELRQLTNEELIDMGFSNEDISKIKNATRAQQTYGNVTYTISYSEMYRSGGNTYLTTKMTWDWSSEPSFLSTDIVAMTTSENFTKNSAYVKVNYYAYGNKNSTKTSEYGTVQTENSGKGVFYRITMGKEWDTINKKYKKVALSGEMETEWSVSGSISQVGIASNYGHSIVTLTPSVSFGGGYSISFTPEYRCVSGDEAYAKAYV